MSEVPKSDTGIHATADATNPFAPIDYTSRLSPLQAHRHLSRHAAAPARTAVWHRPLDESAQAVISPPVAAEERRTAACAGISFFFGSFPSLRGSVAG